MYLEKLSLTGRTALVSGRGNGFAICAALAEVVAPMIIANGDERDERDAEQRRQALRAKGYPAAGRDTCW